MEITFGLHIVTDYLGLELLVDIVIRTAQMLGDLSLYEDTMFTDGATVGFYRLMTCVRDALVFEISHRDQIEAEEKVEKLLKTTETHLKYHHRKHEKRQAEARKILGIDNDESGEITDTTDT